MNMKRNIEIRNMSLMGTEKKLFIQTNLIIPPTVINSRFILTKLNANNLTLQKTVRYFFFLIMK
jgi:hypothetical protein